MIDLSPNTSTDTPHSQPNGARIEKRKADDTSNKSAPTHTRSKRNRYISIACNECKRRKIKCNGQTPCQRCGNLNLECVYAPNCCTTSLKDSEEFQHMRETITTLQDQVNALWESINELRNRQEVLPVQSGIYPPEPQGDATNIAVARRLPPLISPRRQSQKTLPQFRGSTSSTYGFDVAKSSLQTMGITPNSVDEGGPSCSHSRTASPAPMPPQFHPSKDPIWSIDQNEAIRLCNVYEEEIHIMYPILDLDKLRMHAKMLYGFIAAAIRTGFSQPSVPGEDALNDEQTTVLKLVLGITMIVEGSGRSELGQRLFDSAKYATDLTLTGALSLRAITLVVLTATFHFQKDDERQAWRYIGLAARLCVEMGLHRSESLARTFRNESEYREALRDFWVVYALDRRWSFGTGMPFALQDSDIDRALPEPDDTFIYLKYITRHNKIATKIWQHNVAYDSGNSPKTDEIDYLDYQISQWYNGLPDTLKLYAQDLEREKEIANRGLRRLRFLMYLRKNQARMSVYRPIMHSATSIMQNRPYASELVTIARDTIKIITGVNRTSDIYRTQQVCFNYFLVQALAAIFLAVAHAPVMFCHNTKSEFYAAIDLIKGFSTKSYAGKRLWETIRGLREMGDKIGALEKASSVGADQPHDPHADAAAAMADLAGQKVESFDYGTRLGRADDLSVSPQDVQQMGNELTALFELAGAYGNSFPEPNNPEGYTGFGLNGEAIPDGDVYAGLLGNEPEVTRIMSGLL